jgi:hypothetical protein
MPPNNCGNQSPSTNPALTGLQNQFAGRVFSFFDFEKVIKDTLDNDAVIQNVRQRSPHFVGSPMSYNNIVANSIYFQFLNAYIATNVMYKKMETIRYQYLVQAALQCLTDDSLAADPSTGEVFQVSVREEHPKSNKANLLCKEFESHFKIDRVISSVIEDAIFWGEYSLTLQNKKNNSDTGISNSIPQRAGISAILDANPPGTIFGVWDGVHPKYYVRLKKGINTSVQGQLERIEPTSVWNINIFPQKLRFSLGYGNWYLDDSNRISHFFRVGRPLFHSVYNKILELEAFEASELAKEFADLRRRGIVAVDAPQGLDLDQLQVFTQFYENILNETNGASNLEEIQGLDSIQFMMQSLSKVRVVPQQPDRGAMKMVDLRTPTDDMMQKIQDRRKIILEAIGIPYEYVFGQREGGKVNLRQYIRYSRRCRDIQDGVAWALQRLYRTHLMNNGISVQLEDIRVKFYNTINVAELDRLEFLDANIALLKNIESFLNELAGEETAKYINVSEKMRYYAKVLGQMEGVKNIIQVPEGENKKALTPSELDAAMSQNLEGGGGEGNVMDGTIVPEPVLSKPETPSNVKFDGEEMPSNVTAQSVFEEYDRMVKEVEAKANLPRQALLNPEDISFHKKKFVYADK